jgi:LPS export ABC transporter protein LptC
MNARRFYITGVLLLAAAGCQNGAVAPAGQDLPKLAADRVMYGMDHTSSTNGVKRSRTHADTAFVFTRPDSPSLQLRVLHIDMYEDNGAKSATVTARSGTLNTQTKAMVARGNVVLITVKEGKRIETEELHYDPNQHRIWSNVRTVIVSRDGSRQTTESFTADDQFRNISGTGMRGSVTGIKF